MKNNNFKYADDTILMTESEEPLDEGEKESEKTALKVKYNKLLETLFRKNACLCKLDPDILPRN